MKKIYLLILFGVAISGQAQRFDWVEFISSASTNNSVQGAYDMVRDPEGNLYTMSTFETDIMVGDELIVHEGLYNNRNMVVIKWSPAGEIIAFKKIYAQSAGLNPHQLAFDDVNDQLILSTEVSGQPVIIPDDNVSLENSDTAVQILRFDSDLQFVSNIPHYYTYACPLATREGFTYYAHGYNSKVFKVNSENEVSWSIMPDASGSMSIYGLTVAPDGTIFVSARVTWNSSITFGAVTVNVPPGNGDQLVVFKISPDGEVLAGKYITRSTSFYTRMPILADDNGAVYLMAGWFAPDLSIGPFPLSNVNNGNDAFVVKLDENLDPVWVTEFKITEGNMQTNDLALSDSGYLLAAGSYNQNGSFGDFQLPYAANGSGFLAKLNPADGQVAYAVPLGSTQWTGNAVAVVPNGTAFYCAGLTNGLGENSVTFGCYTSGTPGMYLTKIEDVEYDTPTLELAYTNGVLVSDASAEAVSYQWFLGTTQIEGADSPDYTPAATGTYTVIANFEYGCSAEATIEVTSLSTVDREPDGIRVYPNPSEGIFSIDNPNAVPVPVVVSDLNGRKILESTFTNRQNRVDLSAAESGIYVLKLSSETGNKSIRLIKL
ncbi:T9SS type A sorting domain-containing protein [Flavobacterium silvaticum]|uniref:T9SS type A sorting domain-containing protein n=1 Tax=Flavobacterium silvaticum TaxID=1852020 RepID=A0A972FLY4_9FLAO|nr:T9SS type A sorting domain-containing protein [Flavobacterium silvaticum]NMH27655.1 T9SS type A sorting domain-containing protein [Flavobacterium silvaticum]